MSPALSQVVASGLLARLAASGVTDFLIAPGSRSQSLAIAAGQLERAGLARVIVRLDERSLGFTALGLAAATQRVVAVITTSGSAVANLHPAVLEAHHAGTPLLLLTADRPHELRGVGANQTTNQVGIFADAVRHCFDIPAAASLNEAEEIVAMSDRALAIATGRSGDRPGPVQLNLSFREPLSATEPDAAAEFQARRGGLNSELARVANAQPATDTHELLAETPGCVIAGSNAGIEAAKFAQAAGWPLFAEPNSGARTGPNLVPRYADILRAGLSDEAGDAAVKLVNRIRQVVIFGRPTLNRLVSELLARDEIAITVVRDELQGTYDPTRRAERFTDSVSSAGMAEPAWLAAWIAASSSAPNSDFDSARQVLVRELFSASRADGRALLLGASDLIRQADRWAPDCAGLQVFANRGISGIDGTISTAQGIALSGQFSGVRVLLGDLTFLHDLASLNQTELPQLNVQLVVGNDFGGRIFQKLRVADSLPEQDFQRLFLTPQNLELRALAGAFGWAYVGAENPQDLAAALRETGPQIIEYRLPT